MSCSVGIARRRRYRPLATRRGPAIARTAPLMEVGETSAYMKSLADRALTYGCPGATAPASPTWTTAPAGFRRYEKSVTVNGNDWTAQCEALMAWAVKTRSGFRLEDPGPPPTTPGRRLWLTAVIGPIRIREPVEVVAAFHEADRCGFAYGTLTGHPVSGEEAFILSRTPAGDTYFTLRSLTQRPAGWWRAVFPLAIAAQRFYRRRYLLSLRQ